MSEPRAEPPDVQIAEGQHEDTRYWYVADAWGGRPPSEHGAAREPAAPEHAQMAPAQELAVSPRELFEQAQAEAPATEQDAEIEAIAAEWAALVDALAAVIRREVRAALEERGL